ncbi:hypothetical protein POTOM_020931 [Populus tomentosa]|uniref:S-acyltransferase n=1 Tax=Populus tomentosa TaxID=118781 RepID=A0A8X7ZPK3_POPTO|nr:hypothetical protein POTOM_020931 [Populus tomentosa]
MAIRVYRVWEGRNIFFIKWRLMFGPDARLLVITLLLIVVPIVIFCTTVARNLLHEFPTYNAGYVILVVTILFTIYVSLADSFSALLTVVLVLLFLTSACDPGIVPRNSHPPEEEIDSPKLQKDVVVNDFVIKVKYCDTCKIYRPPRCSHCRKCDNCVERFDHHCPWVGQCIGLRNYRYFFLLVSSSALLCIFIFAMSALNIKFVMNDHGTLWKAIKESLASVILMVYSFIFFWLVGGLTCFHLYLIGRNQTTHENYKQGNKQNVYDRGCFRNFREVFCTKTKSSRYNFRAYIQEEKPMRIAQEVKIDDEEGDGRTKVQARNS